MKQQTIAKKKPQQRLNTGYNKLKYEEITLTLVQIRKKLMRIFANHIGKDNATNPFDLFVLVYGFSPMDLDVYKRQYLWNLIKIVLKELRHEGELFTIFRGNRLFVLCNNEELDAYKKRIDTHIINLNNLKSIAEDWVKTQKWHSIQEGE